MKGKVLLALAVTGSVLVGCGGSQGLKSVGLPWSGQMTAEEREAKRYAALGLEEICDTCKVTGGGAGNLFACTSEDESVKFGLVGIDTDALDGTDGKGHIQVQFGTTNPSECDIGGKVDIVRCLNIEEGMNGQTTGTVELEGTLMKTTGLTGTAPFHFLVTVTDFDEPNTGDAFAIVVTDSTGTVVKEFSCITTDDGNIQIHPTRADQLTNSI